MAEQKQTKAERRQAGGPPAKTKRRQAGGAQQSKGGRGQAAGAQASAERPQAAGAQQSKSERRQARAKGGRQSRRAAGTPAAALGGNGAAEESIEVRLARVEEAVATQSELSEEILGRLDQVLEEARRPGGD